MVVRMTRRWIVIATLVVAAGAMACNGSDSPTSPTETASPNDSGGSGGNGPGATPAGSGRLTVRMKDTPFSDAKAVLVTFREVKVHRSDSDSEDAWESIDFAADATLRTCDLKQLQNNATDVLGVATLPAGHYTQIRLIVESAALYFDTPALSGPCGDPAAVTPAGTPVELKIPSGTVKLNREFTVADGGATTMLLDFDGDKSIKQTGGSNGNGNGASKGGYTMTPVIHVVSVQ